MKKKWNEIWPQDMQEGKVYSDDRWCIQMRRIGQVCESIDQNGKRHFGKIPTVGPVRELQQGEWFPGWV